MIQNRRKADKVVIFDCDGVMFDSKKANKNFYNHILSHFGLPPMTEGQVEYVHMHTVIESLRFLFKDTPYFEDALRYREVMDYRPFIKDMVMEDGLVELLEMLRPRYGLAVATNRSNTIGEVLKTFKIDHFFDIVISSLDVKNPKPHPESLIKILNFFNISAENAYYVGDSPVDSQTAYAARVNFIAYKRKDLRAHFMIDHLMEIINILSN